MLENRIATLPCRASWFPFSFFFYFPIFFSFFKKYANVVLLSFFFSKCEKREAEWNLRKGEGARRNRLGWMCACKCKRWLACRPGDRGAHVAVVQSVTVRMGTASLAARVSWMVQAAQPPPPPVTDDSGVRSPGPRGAAASQKRNGRAWTMEVIFYCHLAHFSESY